MTTLDYRVTPVDVAAHRFAVELRTTVTAQTPLRLQLPGWIPGSYLIRDFARHLLSIDAQSDGRPIEVRSLDRQAWECTPGGEQLTVICEFYARDASVRAAFVDDTRGPHACVLLGGRDADTGRLVAGQAAPEWRLAIDDAAPAAAHARRARWLQHDHATA